MYIINFEGKLLCQNEERKPINVNEIEKIQNTEDELIDLNLRQNIRIRDVLGAMIGTQVIIKN